MYRTTLKMARKCLKIQIKIGYILCSIVVENFIVFHNGFTTLFKNICAIKYK